MLDNNNKPSLISVIIPAYNRASIVLKSINSVLNQTYSNLELIVVDDCSTDNTKEVVKSITDPRFRYVCLEKNSGACVARNRGVEEAKGDFIAFNDSDDLWHKDKLEKQLEILQKQNADIVLCKMKCFDENNNFLHDFPEKENSGFVTYEDLLFYNCSSTQTFFGKAECFKKIKFNNTMPRLQDWDEILRLSQNYKIYLPDEVLVDTFIQKDSISTHPEKGLFAMEKLFEKHKDAILSSKKVTESFFKKKSAFSCLSGKNPAEEMNYVYKANPNMQNLLKLSLAKIGLYKILFNLKNR